LGVLILFIHLLYFVLRLKM